MVAWTMNVKSIIVSSLALAICVPGAARGFDPEAVRTSPKPLDLSVPADTNPLFKDYFSYYDLNSGNAAHYFGTLLSDTFTIAAHVFIPDSAAGTVYMVHGYYDHVGILHRAIRLCLDNHLCVAALDLPGHGMSSGERAAIDDFSQYAHAIDGLFRRCRRYLPRPYVIMAHSIGCAATLEYVWTSDTRDISVLIFLAPGLRSTYHGLSRFGHAILGPFADTSPRWFREASHDKVFLEWFRNDPLQYDRFPLRWANAFYAWQNRMNSCDTLSIPVTMIQGTDDDVVDWERNMRALKEKAPNVKIVPVAGARHQILNESEPWRGEVLRAIEAELGRYLLQD